MNPRISLEKKFSSESSNEKRSYVDISHEYLMELLESSKLNLWLVDVTTNEVFDFGYSDSLALLNKETDKIGTIDHFITRLHPEDREEIVNKLSNSLNNYEDYDAEFRIKISGEVYEWVSACGRYIFDADNKPIKMIGTWRFITEHKNTQELVRLQQTTLNRLSRCYFLGEVASSLAHEISQPLLALNSYLTGSLLRLQQEDIGRNEFLEMLQKAGEQVEVMNNIIIQIKRFVTHGELHFQRINLIILVTKIVSLARFSSNFSGTIEYEFDEGLTEICLDKNQIKQVFLNLINNAFESMSEALTQHPKILIKIENTDGGVEIRIIDNGPGISQELVDNLFVGGYSTKQYGFGIGLSMCRKIIEAHGGHFKIERNASGKGTVCSFRLPYRTLESDNES